jgi:hypothetical protein
MNSLAKLVFDDPLPARRPVYDPNNLHPLDAEARQYDDTSEGIDWDQIIATTQDDWEARRFAFNSDDYPDNETAMTALEQLLDSILQKVLHREAAFTSRSDAPRP